MNNNWNIKTLGTVAKYVNGRAFKPSEWEESGLPIIRIQNLTGEKSKYNYSSMEHEGKYRVQHGDLLFAWSASLGAHIWKNGDAWLNQHIFHVIPNVDICKDYLYYFLKSVVADLYSKTHGSGMVHITKSPFMATKIPVPSLFEQQHIVTRIEELFSDLDKAVETLQMIKQQLAVYRQAVLKEAFSQTNTLVELSNISKSRLGKMLDKEKNIGTPRGYLRNINVRWFSFDLSDVKEMGIEDSEIDKYSIQKDDLLICEGGEPGRCAVWEKDDTFYYQKALHSVRFSIETNPRFYMYYIWFVAQTGKLNPYFTGTGIKHLTKQFLERLPVPKVTKEIQDKIVDEIESRLSVCNCIEQTVEMSLKLEKALRQSILKSAFEGRMVKYG